MGRIQTNIGLITGMPIGETVAKLMALAAKPRNLLEERTATLRQEQVAITELSAMLASVGFVTGRLGKEKTFDKRTVTSSDSAALSATLTGEPAKGSLQFTPLQTVQQQQLLSRGLKSDTASMGGGKLTFRFGDHVLRSADLDQFGGGDGVARGTFRITDRSGATADIDLATARTVEDVIKAINGATQISVTATVSGDRLRLTDNTGQTLSNLKVQEVGGGTTAASLGLDGIDLAANSADGRDMLWLTEDMDLDLLGDGNGVHVDRVSKDISYQLRDGITSGEIDLSPIIVGGSDVDTETTLGEIIAVINAAEPGKLRAEIAPDGDRLILTDMTTGSDTFQVSSINDSTIVEDLGLTGPSEDGVITGRRIIAGARTVLISSLNGGNGPGQLGTLELTDRGGASDTVDLSAADTLEEVIDLINSADVGIAAAVNEARNGIQLVDTTGASASNLIVANADQTATAEKLRIAVDADVTTAGSGDMHLQIISYNTRLEDLNGGAGVTRGKIEIVDSRGVQSTLDLTGDGVLTVGDVIRRINWLSAEVHAEINQTGDGIRILDNAGGDGTLQVRETSWHTAAELHLLGEAVEVDVDGELTQVIDGSTTYTIELDEDESLQDLSTKINELAGGLQTAVFSDGSAKPFRLSAVSRQAGSAGQLVIDTSGLNLTLEETVRGRDALLVLGTPDASGSNVLISSSTNTFGDVMPGVSLEIKQPSSSAVTISVRATDADVIAAVTTMVANYNGFRARLEKLTKYDVATEKASILTGDATALRLDTEPAYLFSGRFFGAGSIKSLGELGVSLKDDGTLEFNTSKLKAKFAEDPEAVKEFFTHESFGLAAKFGRLVDQLSGQEGSLLSHRSEALDRKVTENEKRIAFLNDRLQREEELLYEQFYRMEMAIGKMQSSLSALNALNPLAPMSTWSNRE